MDYVGQFGDSQMFAFINNMNILCFCEHPYYFHLMAPRSENTGYIGMAAKTPETFPNCFSEG